MRMALVKFRTADVATIEFILKTKENVAVVEEQDILQQLQMSVAKTVRMSTNLPKFRFWMCVSHIIKVTIIIS